MKYPKWLIILGILSAVVALYEFVKTSEGWAFACGIWAIACAVAEINYNKLFDKKQ